MEMEVSSSKATKKIIFNKYELGKLLGCGAFAKVYHARNVLSNASVAIKIIPKSRSSSAAAAGNHHHHHHISREVSILSRLRHPHIIRLHEVLASRTKIFLVLDFAKGGELFSRVEKLGRLPEHLCRLLAQQLLSAVAYSHSRGVFHRDLKPENLLLLDDHSPLHLKITDFGLSAIHPNHNPSPLLHTLCGTPAYVAPEILAKRGYRGDRVDVWSCGVILFVLCAGYLPFNDPNLMKMYKKIYCGEFRVPKWVSAELKRLICRMLDPNPETRITVEGILHDPWFCRGLDVGRWTAEMKFGSEAEEKEEEEMEMEGGRELNAFDLISMSSGVNLGGLFEEGGCEAAKERFVSGAGVEEVVRRVEGVGRREGWHVRRNGGGGVVVVRGSEGRVVARVGVYRLGGEVVVVEVEKGVAHSEKIITAIRDDGQIDNNNHNDNNS